MLYFSLTTYETEFSAMQVEYYNIQCQIKISKHCLLYVFYVYAALQTPICVVLPLNNSSKKVISHSLHFTANMKLM